MRRAPTATRSERGACSALRRWFGTKAPAAAGGGSRRFLGNGLTERSLGGSELITVSPRRAVDSTRRGAHQLEPLGANRARRRTALMGFSRAAGTRCARDCEHHADALP